MRERDTPLGRPVCRWSVATLTAMCRLRYYKAKKPASDVALAPGER